MLTFASDYVEGAHENIIKAFQDTIYEQNAGYGMDRHSLHAAQLIKEECRCPEAEVRFLTGGTQTNQLAIDCLTGMCDGVIAAEPGHVATHEAGAIELTGHKVITLPAVDGKLTAESVDRYVTAFYADEVNSHMVRPAMVYISHPSERGTIYSLKELTALSDVCRRHSMPLYLDGARLGYGLMSYDTDVTLADIARLCDAFYIGGTKVGALCGEALVFTKGNMPQRITAYIKSHGALLAKGWLTGMQFEVLFTDGLYYRISRHAIDMARKIRDGFIAKGYSMWCESPTNQQFPILENRFMEKLAREVGFSVWEPFDADHTVCRFASSWATKEENVDKLMKLL